MLTAGHGLRYSLATIQPSYNTELVLPCSGLTKSFAHATAAGAGNELQEESLRAAVTHLALPVAIVRNSSSH